MFEETGYDSCLTHGQYKLNSWNPPSKGISLYTIVEMIVIEKQFIVIYTTQNWIST